MTKKASPRSGATRGSGTFAAIRWHRRQLSKRFVIRSDFGYAVAGLALAALGMLWALGTVGCGPAQTFGYMEAPPGTFFSQARQSPFEVARHLRNAHYYKLMGRADLALKELEDAQQQNPDNLKIANSLAQGYEEQGHFEAARKIYQEVLTRNGPNRALANNLCFTYYLEGRWQEAESCFRQTLARDPGNVAARNNLGLLYCRLGRQDEARQLWEEAEGSAAASAKIHQALAALGIGAGAVYAQAPKSAPPVAEISTPVAAAASPSMSAKQKRLIPATAPPQPKVARLAPPAQPAPVLAAPDSNRPVVKASPAPPETALTPAAAATPVPRADTRPQPAYLTALELVNTGIEVRNGTPRPHLAREMGSLLDQEAFTVVKIGNHVNFGAEKTLIYYRPQAQRVAKVLRDDILPLAGLEPSDRLKGQAAIKVLLGHDLLRDPAVMARLRGDQPQPAVAATTPVPHKRLAATATAPLTKASQAASQEKAPQALSRQPFTPPTAAELEDTAIEILNGNGSQHLAHKMRTLLSLEGFAVAKIGNYIDFGAQKTVIYFRPEREKVARALGLNFFPQAALEASQELPHNIAVKILLGADLLQRPQLMARLSAPGQ
jgi:Flp pilus assembly protein TadD